MHLCARLLLAAASLSPSSLLFADDPVELPDSPGVSRSVAAGHGTAQAGRPDNTAPRYADIIQPWERAPDLPDSRKPEFALRELARPFNLVSASASAGWSHLVDSAPHYGTNSTAFAQRFGAAMARQSAQTVFTDGIFSPLMHDDPRYYILGRKEPIMKRVVYAATRVVVTRANDGHQRFNAPLFAGYAATSALNNAFYPDQDRTFKRGASGYATSLAGAALGFEVNEFMGDLLRLTHLAKN